MATPDLRPCVFLDRDGTLAEEVGYINHLSRLKLIPGAAQAVRKLNDAGVLAIVVSNQAGVARGYFTEEMMRDAMAHLEKLLAQDAGARLDAIYCCPFHPQGKPPYNIDSPDRKPKPGMIHRARAQHPIDMARSYMAGDRALDVAFGQSVGLRTVMVLTGYGRGEWEYQRHEFPVQPGHVCDDLPAAVEWILSDLSQRTANPSHSALTAKTA